MNAKAFTRSLRRGLGGAIIELRNAKDKAAYREYMKQKAELIGWEEKSQARTLIEQDRKIEAIKLVREAAGIGLAEARDMVCEHSDLL